MGKVELKIVMDADLLADARAAGLQIDDLTDAIVRDVLRRKQYQALSEAERARRWGEENAEAIKAHREQIEKHGVFGEDLRTW